MVSMFVCSYGILLVRIDFGAWLASFPPFHLQTTGLPNSTIPGTYILSRSVLPFISQDSSSYIDIAILGANVALLMYDITNASTFEEIRGWLQGDSRLIFSKSEADPPLRY